MNKKLYSFRFEENLIQQLDKLTEHYNMNRTQFITMLVANELRLRHDQLHWQSMQDSINESCKTVTNPPVSDTL